jgi:hypothetical protein
VFLRFPGQWEDGAWENAGVGSGLSYNVFRWYDISSGRYTALEPVRWLQYTTHFLYAQSRPSLFVDPIALLPCTGLMKPNCCDSGGAPLGRAFNNLLFRRSLYCANRDKPAITVGQGEKKGWVEIPEQGPPVAHYIPQGDRCLDWCICDHENYHIEQALSGELRNLSHNNAECRAYNRHLACLNGLTRKGPLSTGG